MDGVKRARINRCTRCEFCIRRPADFAGPRGYAKFCAFRGRRDPDLVELHNARMEGPDENCPAGHWYGLEPVGPTDPGKWAEWNRRRQHRRRVEQQRARLKPILQAALGDLRPRSTAARLERLVRAGRVAPEVAAEIMQELEATTATTEGAQ